MERLTIQSGQDRIKKWTRDEIMNVLLQLQKYEDTGLSPEEIEALKAENSALTERLKKYVELPCKVGDTVWINYLYEGQYENKRIFEQGEVDSILYYCTHKSTVPQIEIIVSSNECCLSCSPNDDRIWWDIKTKEVAEAHLKELEKSK
jgi:hypothetical protein